MTVRVPAVARWRRCFGSNEIGAQICEPSGKAKRGGATPMTWCGSPSTMIVRPTIAGSPSKRRFQMPSQMTTT